MSNQVEAKLKRYLAKRKREKGLDLNPMNVAFGVVNSKGENKMATSKKTGKKASRKKVAKKKTTTTKRKKVAKKKVVRKKAAPGRAKNSFLVGDFIKPVTIDEKHFYTKFPRYKAYKMLQKAGELPVKEFISRVEKMSGVNSRSQALGIMIKLIEKGAASTRFEKKARAA